MEKYRTTRHHLAHQTRSIEDWGRWGEAIANTLDAPVMMTVVTAGEQYKERAIRPPLIQSKITAAMETLESTALESITLRALGRHRTTVTLKVRRWHGVGAIVGALATIRADETRRKDVLKALADCETTNAPETLAIPDDNKVRHIGAITATGLVAASAATLCTGGIAGFGIGFLICTGTVAWAFTLQETTQEKRHRQGAGLGIRMARDEEG